MRVYAFRVFPDTSQDGAGASVYCAGISGHWASVHRLPSHSLLLCYLYPYNVVLRLGDKGMCILCGYFRTHPKMGQATVYALRVFPDTVRFASLIILSYNPNACVCFAGISGHIPGWGGCKCMQFRVFPDTYGLCISNSHYCVYPLILLEPLENQMNKEVPIEESKIELNPLPESLKYAFLGPSETLPVIIGSDLDEEREDKLINVHKEHKEAIGWTISDIKGISPSICMHRIHLEENAKTSREFQRRLNPNLKEVVRTEIIKLLDVGIIYPISDSSWVSLVHIVPKKSGITVITNEENELVPTRFKLVSGQVADNGTPWLLKSDFSVSHNN
ncbi:hypothetical protein OROGR_020544 [Orobanche gracilis]